MSVDLSTTYLGLKLKNPLVVGACPLGGKLDNLKSFEQAGAAAAVLPSLFEEQICHDEVETAKVYEFGADSFAEALTYFPEQEDYGLGPDEYLRHISACKRALSIPVIPSLNGSSRGGWMSYARQMQDAGADALELNIYFVAADPDESGAQVEARYVDMVAAVKDSVSIPLAVKVGPYFSSMAHMARRLVEAGADGLILFNRFLQPDIDLENLEVTPKLVLSEPHELLLPLRWVAILYGRLNASLAITSGIHSGRALVKAVLAGANVGKIASLLYKEGAKGVARLLVELREWMEENEYTSVTQMRGSMSQQNCPDPRAFERGNYMKALTSFTGNFI